jgi:antitoxin (DNA-binding transcriptional repressor) of toxin-antitoxin stability system
MQTLTVEQAEAHFTEIIDKLAPGEEIVLTRNDRPVAKLVGTPRPVPGRGKGMLSIISEDDDHLKDFVEHMP